MRAIIGIAIVTAILTGGAWDAATKDLAMADRCEQEAFVPLKPGTPKKKAQAFDDTPANPVKIENGILVPIDPAKRKKAEEAVECREMSGQIREVLWIIPVLGLVLMALTVLHR